MSSDSHNTEVRTGAEPAETGQILRDRRIHDEWRSLYRREQVEALQRLYLSEVVRRLGLRPGMKILHAGCWTAFNAVRLAEMGLEIDGVDLSRSAIAEGATMPRPAEFQTARVFGKAISPPSTCPTAPTTRSCASES